MNIFNSIPLLKPKRNTFNLGHEVKLTTDFARLTPFLCQEALPDDVFKLRAEVFCRVSPMIAPVMHRFNIRYYFFFVPTRIIWDDFEKWINPKSGVSDIVAPRVKITEHWMDSTAVYSLGPKTLADYLGLNFGLAAEDQGSPEAFLSGIRKAFTVDGHVQPVEVSSLPFRAYQQIYNDWFIDVNNMDLHEFSKGSGVEELDPADIPAGGSIYDNPLYKDLLQIRHRAWEHDYLTSAMPNAQRGEDVYAFDGSNDLSISVEGQPKVYGNVNISDLQIDVLSNPNPDGTLPAVQEFKSLNQVIRTNFADYGFNNLESFVNVTGAVLDGEEYRLPSLRQISGSSPSSFAGNIINDGEHGLFMELPFKRNGSSTTELIRVPIRLRKTNGAEINVQDIARNFDLSGNIQAVTVEELRVRMQMQSFLERNEIGGSRYTEMLYAHWGVKSQDGRLQRSQFIGGGKQPIMINDISQTSAPTDDDPLGQYAGQGVSSGMSKPIKFRVPEHGFIIGLMCVMPRTGYFQGLHKMWKRFDRLDMYWPSFAFLGEQEVKNHEVLHSAFDPDGTFGYQQRYAEYKCALDEIHGDFKGNLAFYHDARIFATPTSSADIPKLSEGFTVPSETSDDLDRIFPVLNDEVVWKNADHFLLDIYVHNIASRRMPKFVTPRNGS